ncbi:dihydroneopterin aldolase [Aureibacter tunicatorum]|uniref:7,8-dihydroneopterin aldolase n=1 Tax=Aureibacter tunicatorum TaxID=866807 RepID=A0AAE4BUG8_9BACT|nr:dihydroneopterin aldolase [Aureibacter tunicatorum]MDR6241045.1 dihydroneopterin aldolase [Aureibacter tunicatorum]BDD03823.1 7,8-dihydroneopterin aldolase [Aureibacter tunicatorum]
MGKICLEGLEFYAYHGFYEEEQKIGNKYEINIEVDADFNDGAVNDDLIGTISYEDLYRIIKKEMEIKSKLLEHVGYRIIKKIFKLHPAVEKVRLEVVKFNPPIGGICRKAKIVLDETNDTIALKDSVLNNIEDDHFGLPKFNELSIDDN